MRTKHVLASVAVTPLALGLLLGAHCERRNPVPPVVVVDAGPAPVDAWIDPWEDSGSDAAPAEAGPQECTDPIDQCDRAGCHLLRLGCERARTPNGTPFTQACHDAMLDGRFWPTQCIVAAPTCTAAEACR